MKKNLERIVWLILSMAVSGLANAEENKFLSKERSIHILYTASSNGYFKSCGCNSIRRGGLEARLTVIDSLKKIYPNLLLIDGGDTGESPGKRFGGKTPILWEAMADLGYDVIAVGKKDLSDSSTVWLRRHKTDDVAFLTGNIVHKKKKRKLGASYKILKRNKLKVGVASLVDPQFAGYFRKHALLGVAYRSAPGPLRSIALQRHAPPLV